MSQKQMQLECKISPAVFRRFAVFDTLYRQRRWRGPVLFAAIMLFFAAVCLSQVGKLEQAWLVGGILLVVGAGLPCVYFASFFLFPLSAGDDTITYLPVLNFSQSISPASISMFSYGNSSTPYICESILCVL